MSQPESNRLRTPPRERFDGDSSLVDLDGVFRDLAAEEQSGVKGHNQITVFKSGASTVVAFLFEQGGHLPTHKADGFVTIQVIDGSLEIETPSEEQTVSGGELLVFRPGVPHEVRALEQSKMLLTVHLRGEHDHP